MFALCMSVFSVSAFADTLPPYPSGGSYKVSFSANANTYYLTSNNQFTVVDNLLMANGYTIYMLNGGVWSNGSTSSSTVPLVGTVKEFTRFNYTNSSVVSDYALSNNIAITVDSPPQLIPIMKKVELTGVLQQIVGILPLLIGLTVSFLGLRKGLAWLSSLLRQA